LVARSWLWQSAQQAIVIGKGQTGRRPLPPLLQCEIGHMTHPHPRHLIATPRVMFSSRPGVHSIRFRNGFSRLIVATDRSFAELTGLVGPV
jgi:hypothetical protein